MDSIPLFPPWCVVEPIETVCTAHGISMSCTGRPDYHDVFTELIDMGHRLTALVLIGVGLINLSYAKWPVQREHSMKYITGLYAFLTGLFTMSRLYFGISRITLIMAAVHNLCEWSMLMMVAAVNKSERDIEKRIKYFFFYIYGVIMLVAMLPTIAAGLVFEQTSGITIDFTLAIVFTYMYVVNRDKPDVKSFYYLPMLAHTVHLFFTILPLVMTIFHAQQSSWYTSFFLETIVYISAPITHTLYMNWSFKVDTLRDETAKKDKSRQVPASFRVTNLKVFVAMGAALGFGTILGISHVLGTCSSVPSCAPSSHVTGTCEAIVHPGFELAFEDYIDSQQLVSKARTFKGNEGYSIVKDANNPNNYRFIEHWATKEDLNEWVTQVGSKVFSQPALVNLLVGGKLQHLTMYTSVQPSACRGSVNGGVNVFVDSGCDKVWSVVSNWSDCSWMIGCKYSVVDPKTNIRTIHFDDGTTGEMILRKSDRRNHELVYEVIEPSGHIAEHTGTVKVDGKANVPTCQIMYKFTVSKKTSAASAAVVYHDFLGYRIPALQQKFKDD